MYFSIFCCVYNSFQNWLPKQEEVMELKQGLRKLKLSRIKSEPEVSCVYLSISTASLIHTHAHVTTPQQCFVLTSIASGTPEGSSQSLEAGAKRRRGTSSEEGQEGGRRGEVHGAHGGNTGVCMCTYM